MKIGVCTAPENITASVEGLSFIEPGIANLLCPREDEGVFRSRLEQARACPLPIYAANMLFPGDLKTTGPDVNDAALDMHINTTARRAKQAGVQILVFGSGGSRKVPDGFSHERASAQLIGHMKRWGPILAQYDVTLVLEPLNSAECNIVNSVTEGAELVREVAHPSVRLLADTFHMARDGEGADSIRQAGELIVHAHCAEANGRVPVGFGGEDHRPYFRALKDIGYAGSISIEAKWQDFAAQLADAVRLLREQIETA